VIGRWQIDGTKKYAVREEDGYKKGTVQGEDVMSNDRNAYPNKEAKDGVWYIYKGIF